MKEIDKVQARKQNMRIYVLYRTLSLDLLFFYGISFLFLTQVKGFTAAEVISLDAIFAAFMILLQIPATILIERIGTRNSTILGNVFNILFLLTILLASNMTDLLIAYMFSAMCFALKDVSDPSLLNYSIPKTDRKGEIFAKLEGKANRRFHLFNAVSSVGSGLLFMINPYVPMVFALLFAIAGLAISFAFTEVYPERIHQQKREAAMKRIKTVLAETKEGFAFIFQSERLRSLILFSGVIWGVMSLFGSYRPAILVQLGAPAVVLTMVHASIQLGSAIAIKKQNAFHKYFRNKGLSVLLITATLCMLFTGWIGLSQLSAKVAIMFVAILYIVNHGVRGINGVIIQRYLANFSNKNILPKIYSADAIIKNLFRMVIIGIGSYMLGITDTANAMVIMGIMFIFISIGLVSYMKTRVGLKPNEYKEEDINFVKKDEVNTWCLM